MKRLILLAATVLTAVFSANAQSTDNGDGTFTNPVIWADCPDPDVIRVGDDYYFVSTTMHLMPGAPIMHSKDLVNWEIISYIYDRFEETPRYSLEEGTVYGRGQWATSLRYRDGVFYAYFTPNDQPAKGYVYKTTDPRGKWERHAVIPHFHDASFFFDEDGRTYMVYGTGMIRELKPDLTGVLEGGLDMKLFERDKEENSLLEGSRMIKYEGKYYLLMISWPRGGIRREVCYRADNIEGPYEKKVILETSFGGLRDGVAQGTIFDDPQGNWYGMIFQDRGGVGRVPTLMPCTWIDGWPMLGDKDGKVPATMEKPVQGQERKALTVSDEFDSDKLSLCWQWNHNPIDKAWSLTERKGHLRLKTNKVVPSIFHARNTLTQRMEGPTCEAVVALDLRHMKNGDVAGFSAFNSDAAVLAITKKNGKLYLSMSEEKVRLSNDTKAITGVEKAMKEEIPLKKKVIYLRIEGDFRPGETKDIIKCSYSLNNRKWHRIGPDYRTGFDWQRFFMGTKFAIFNYATQKDGGYVDVDWFHYTRNQTQEIGTGNPYLPLWEHLPDGEPRVFEDPDNPGKYRAYIIGSHDLRVGSYCGPDIRMWSAPVEDLTAWVDEGPIFTYNIDDQWDVMYAPDLVEVTKRDGTREYYLYPHSRGGGREAFVAKGDRPDGPFTVINATEDGRRAVEGSILGFDPSVFVEQIDDPNDPDYEIGFRAYGYWGFQRSSAVELDQNTMYSKRPDGEYIPFFIPASFRYGVVRQVPGVKEYPALYKDQKPEDFNFFEASSIRKVGNKYVMIFSGYSGPDYGLGSSNSTLRYAYGDSPLGPWRSGGVLVDSRGIVLNEDGSALIERNAAHNTHGSIEQINGQWYAFYHRPPRGFGFARQPMVAPVTIQWDETPVAEGGKVVIRGYDPYAEDGIWEAKASNGDHYTGAEVTSEGFQIFGMPPYKYYSAGYACFLSDIGSQQDNWDIWDNSMPVNVSDKDIVGYKYFGFGGLAEAQKGVQPFEGTQAGNGTSFNVFLTPKTDASFKINVWIDGPWANEAWKGTKIAEINVPAGSAREVTRFTADVAEAVDGLEGKHAVYLVAEGEGDLCELMGLGFSKKGQKMTYPAPPAVSIFVDGNAVEMPKHPVRSTNENGYVGYDQYEANYTVPAEQTKTPKITAKADNSNVKVEVIQPESKTGEAVVKCVYNGVEKTYTVKLSE